MSSESMRDLHRVVGVNMGGVTLNNGEGENCTIVSNPETSIYIILDHYYK